MTPGAGDKLLVMNGPLGQTIGQFKSFFFGAHQRITLRAMQQGRMGQGRVLSAMAAFISLGMLVYYLKSWLSNRETSDDPAVWVREGVDRSGTIPLLMEGFNTAEKMSGQTFVGESPASRYASRNWADAIAGPSFGRLKAVGDVVRNTLDGELQDRDIHSLRKLLPYNNVFLIRKFIDDLEIAAVELTDAEETAISDRREPFLIGQ